MTVAESEPRDLTKAEAEECLTGIRAAVVTGGEWIAKAVNGRAWIALGYKSWNDMCEDRLAGVRLALPRAERLQIVGSLRDQGMSTPAIATGLGIPQSTIADDVKRLTESGKSAPATVTGLDGRLHSSVRPPQTRPPAPAPPEPGAVTPRTKAQQDAQQLIDDARQMSKGIGQAVLTLAGVEIPAFRKRALDFWEIDHADTTPTAVDMFNPAYLRVIAAGLIELADEMESR